jgi:hypothetical protein
MLKHVDLPYFRQRERTEREAAEASRDPASRDAHLRLAAHYSDRVWALQEEQRRNRPEVRRGSRAS